MAATLKTKAILWIWGKTSPAERRLVRKLDVFILTYACLSYFFNYLDRAAFANAYVAGLKEALDLHGNQYNVLLSLMSAGMLVGQIPSSIIIHKIPPRIWLSAMVIAWAGLTMASAGCKTYAQLCAVRFLMGVAESSTYAGCIYVMGSWYKSNEIAKRAAMLTVAGQVGNMFAGAMMAAIHKSMDGLAGLEGWQWVFLIDGIITCPIAVFGLLYFPDVPETTTAAYLSKEERQLALDRLPPKKLDGHNIALRSVAKRVLGQPIFYTCCIFSLFSAALQAYSTQGLMLLYLKSYQKTAGYTQAEINTFPLGIHAIAIVTEFFIAVLVDRFEQRLLSGLLICTIQVVSSVILLIPNMPISGNLTALYLAATAYGINPLLYGWPSNITAKTGDDVLRSVTLASMVASGMLLYTFWGIVIYPANDAPYWKKGYIAMLCMAAMLAMWLFVVHWLDKRTDKKTRGRNSQLDLAMIETVQIDEHMKT